MPLDRAKSSVLGIDITREGFEWALAHAALSTFTRGVHASHDAWRHELENKPVRVQWDPERDWQLRPIPEVHAIQIGLSGEAVERYVRYWIVRIEDMTAISRSAAVSTPTGLPSEMEKAYPLPSALAGICRQ